tara:strand:- start:26 stop:916 length:891 start_codon:yes stop_codon:yes gene_type:complete
MEYDFSDKAKGFLQNQTPDGSSKSGRDSSVGDKVVVSLKNKVKEYNEKYPQKVTLEQLKKVYRRGEGASSSGHRPGKNIGQWAMARVNTFLKMVSGGKVKESYRAADGDIARGSEDYYVEEIGSAFIDYDEVEFGLAKIDLLRAGISELDMDQDIEDIDYSEAEKKTLNKPFRLKDSKKKFGVYVKNPKTGNVIMVKFGDPNMEIKRDDPARRRSFRARHKCDTAKDKTTPRYWSCKFWSKKPVSSMASAEAIEWDDDEVLSEWSWTDDGFAEYEEIIMDSPNLKLVQEIVEEDGI